jgi:hypothetical protein
MASRYCIADAARADFFREKFSSETFNPRARGLGRAGSYCAVPASTENVEGHP